MLKLELLDRGILYWLFSVNFRGSMSRHWPPWSPPSFILRIFWITILCMKNFQILWSGLRVSLGIKIFFEKWLFSIYRYSCVSDYIVLLWTHLWEIYIIRWYLNKLQYIFLFFISPVASDEFVQINVTVHIRGLPLWYTQKLFWGSYMRIKRDSFWYMIRFCCRNLWKCLFRCRHLFWSQLYFKCHIWR